MEDMKISVTKLHDFIGSVVKHKGSGELYSVITVANTHADNKNKFVPTVVYSGPLPSQYVWSRPAVDFVEKFKRQP